MPAARRLLALPAALLLAAGLGAVPANAISAVIDDHTSSIPALAYEISSSAYGTVYSTNQGGFGRTYLAIAPMGVGSTPVDMGPRAYNRMGATIVANRVAFPNVAASGTADYRAPVTSVKTCTVGTCPTMSTMTVPSGWAYAGNAGDAAVLWKPDTNLIAVSSWSGTLGAQYAMPATYPADDQPRISADGTGIVVSGQGDVAYVVRSSGAVTDYDYGDGGVLTGSYVVWYAVGVGPEAGPWVTQIKRAVRGSATATVIRTLADAPGIEQLAASNYGAAWTIPNGDADGSSQLWTMAYDAAAALYARPLMNSGLSTFQDTAAFVVDDVRAGTPGFYSISPGAYSGGLTGLVPVRNAVTYDVAVANGRAVYADDTTEDLPAFVRTVTDGSLGPEESVSTQTSGHVALSGPYVAYTRESGTSTEIWYGRPGGTFSRVTYPTTDVGTITLSGHRLLLTGGVRTRVVDLVTGGVTDLGHTFAAIFGDQVATINYDTGLVQRRNLTTGGAVTLRPAVPGCTTFCMDEDAWHLAIWGDEVVYAFPYGGTTPGHTAGYVDGVAAPVALPMLEYGGELDVWDLAYWDGLLVVSHPHDVRVVLYNLRTSTSAQVAAFAEGPIGIDGNVLTYRPDGDLRAIAHAIVPDFASSYAPDPRWIGGRVPSGFSPATAPWKPAWVFSNEIGGGTVDIHSGSASGAVVRSLSLPATSYGEASVSWDGKDSLGHAVAQGTYYWTLNRAAASPTPINNAVGSPASGSVYVSTAPLAAPPSVNAPTRSTDVSATTTFTVSWGAVSGAPAGTTYTLERSVNGGAYAVVVSGLTSTSRAYSAPAPGTYRFRVKAVDPAGRSGAYSASDYTIVPYDDTSGTFSSGWTSVSGASHYRGAYHRSGTAGATFSFSSTGTQIHLVGPKAASFGQFQVSIDGGAYSSLIDAYSSSTRYRQLLYAKTGLSNATHTVKVRVYGTSGRPYVGIDGVGYLR